MIRIFVTILAAGFAVVPAQAKEKQRDNRVWESSRIFSIRDPQGKMQTGSWQVIERTQERCQIAVRRREASIPVNYPGWRVTGTKRFTPCHPVLTRSSPN